MATTIRRDGRQDILLAAVSSDVVDLLLDLQAVTTLLGELVDQSASSAVEPVRWVIPPIGVGPVVMTTILAPTCVRTTDGVRIHASSVAPSTAATQLQLDMAVAQTEVAGSVGSLLRTTWRLTIAVPVPRLLLVGTRPAIDRTVERVVDDINRRVAAAV